jgi:cell volume regulation protein A
LDEPACIDDEPLSVEFSEGVNLATQELIVSEEDLASGNTLKEIRLPEGALVVVVKRGNEHLVPNGSLEIKEGDRFLMVFND